MHANGGGSDAATVELKRALARSEAARAVSDAHARQLETDNRRLAAEADVREREVMRLTQRLEDVQRALVLAQADAEAARSLARRREAEAAQSRDPQRVEARDSAAAAAVRWERRIEAARLQAEEARWQEAKTRMELVRMQEHLTDVEKQLNETLAKRGAHSLRTEMLRGIGTSRRTFVSAVCDCFRWRRYSAVNESASDLAGASSSGVNSLNSSATSTPVPARPAPHHHAYGLSRFVAAAGGGGGAPILAPAPHAPHSAPREF